ncbi:hypothetical protein BKA66DRAFT_50792 [Pyrenochaeta sp. MPI-SDFR-AT-0127]|nr:hypothetical protein BKA66DRAFT_50792 [Pyrenochaeta sp. MPI-SDFR-AT-0127]
MYYFLFLLRGFSEGSAFVSPIAAFYTSKALVDTRPAFAYVLYEGQNGVPWAVGPQYSIQLFLFMNLACLDPSRTICHTSYVSYHTALSV